LAEARDAAHEARRLIQTGVDPIEARKADKARRSLEAVKEVTFEECGVAYIAAHEAGWRNEKHRWQWGQSLWAYAYPTIGKTSVAAVNTDLILKLFEPIWRTKTETASRLRGRIETILDWATVRGYRTGENQARWRGHLDHLLVRPVKVAKVEHHAALGYDHIGVFMSGLRLQGGSAALALEFLILTAARTGEVIGARWEEIDETAKLWVVPGYRMKSGREHGIPLNDAVIAILERARPLRGRGISSSLAAGQPSRCRIWRF
jgi:integrase